MFGFISKIFLLSVLSAFCFGDHYGDIAQSQDRYKILSDGDVILDQVTHLQWMRCSIGQAWNGTTCEGKPNTFKVLDAIEFGEKFEFNGASDWRLPNYDELVTLIFCSDGKPRLYHSPDAPWDGCDDDSKAKKPAIDLDVFPNTPVFRYWTSDKYNGGDMNNAYWVLCYKCGFTKAYIKAVPSNVRLVKGECTTCK